MFEYRSKEYTKSDKFEAAMTPKPKGSKKDLQKAERQTLYRSLYDKQIERRNVSARTECWL